MHRLLPILALFAVAAAQNGQWRERLLCNRLTGNYVSCCGGVNVQFGRALEAGDKITVNATVGPSAPVFNLRINIRDSTGHLISFHVRTKIPQDKKITFGQVVYNTLLNGKWGKEEYGPNPFAYNSAVQIRIHYTGSGYLVYSGNRLIQTYNLRHVPSVPLMFLEMNGNYRTNWIQMDCARPLPGGGNGGNPNPNPGNGGGPRPGHGHGGHSHGSSSSSSEEC